MTCYHNMLMISLILTHSIHQVNPPKCDSGVVTEGESLTDQSGTSETVRTTKSLYSAHPDNWVPLNSATAEPVAVDHHWVL